jgi:spore coat polysaccharide biosynthesis protein SpsF (cytidylyltransferase family)
VQHAYDQCVGCGIPAVVLPPHNDAAMIDHCEKKNLRVHMVDAKENDVLSRYVALARSGNESHVVRITGDCPFPMPFLHARVDNIDFWSNAHPQTRTTPDGWDLEIMSVEMLEWLNVNSTTAEREHVTAAIYRVCPDGKSAILSMERPPCVDIKLKVSFENWKFDMFKGFPKMSVDTKEDLDRMRAMYVGN